MKYTVWGCRERITHTRERTVISVEYVPYDEAQYFCVYKDADNKGAKWLADFHYLDDAQKFVSAKEAETGC